MSLHEGRFSSCISGTIWESNKGGDSKLSCKRGELWFRRRASRARYLHVPSQGFLAVAAYMTNKLDMGSGSIWPGYKASYLSACQTRLRGSAPVGCTLEVLAFVEVALFQPALLFGKDFGKSSGQKNHCMCLEHSVLSRNRSGGKASQRPSSLGQQSPTRTSGYTGKIESRAESKTHQRRAL